MAGQALVTSEVLFLGMRFKIRLFAFLYLCYGLAKALFWAADGLAATVFGLVLSFVYVKWVRWDRGVRGSRTFSVVQLLPSLGRDELPGASIVARPQIGNVGEGEAQLGSTLGAETGASVFQPIDP
jgi:hypothetical protein